MGRTPGSAAVTKERLATLLDRVAAWLRRPSKRESTRRHELADLLAILPRHRARIVRALVDGTPAATMHAEIIAIELTEIRCALDAIRRTSALRHAALRQSLTEART